MARGADLVGEPEIDEAEAVRWVPVEEALEKIRTGEIIGAATVISVLHAAARIRAARSLCDWLSHAPQDRVS